MNPLRSERARRLAATRLYVILTPDILGPGWLQATERALVGGHVGMLQLRCPDEDDASILEHAATLRAACKTHGCLLILNDRPDLAVAAGADGVHVGQDDASPAEARRAVGIDALVGLSTHGEAELLEAHEAGADYVGLGPCFPSWTKQRLVGTPQGPGLIARCAPLAGDLPVFPIGGITTANAGGLIEAGARRLAVGAGVLAADDPARAAAELAAMLEPAREG